MREKLPIIITSEGLQLPDVLPSDIEFSTTGPIEKGQREYPEDVLEFRKTKGGVISPEDEANLQILKESLSLRSDIAPGSLEEEFIAKQAIVDYYKDLFAQYPEAERFSANKKGDLIPDVNGTESVEDLLLKARIFHSWCIRFTPIINRNQTNNN